jgi:hypothetical protein
MNLTVEVFVEVTVKIRLSLSGECKSGKEEF